MKTKKTEKMQVVILLSLLLMIIVSCTKKVPYEALPQELKVDVVGKDLIDESVQYLYSSQAQNGSRSAADHFPFLSGENKRVKLQLTKDSLVVIEEEKDARFRDNKTNNKMVLQIPIEHVQFQCAKNSFGECTNKEESTDTILWNERNSIRLKLGDVQSGELQLLPLIADFGWDKFCYENISSRLVKSEISKEAINFQIERTFKTSLYCLQDNIEGLSDATISAVYHYSMVRLDSVLSKNYETISYPVSSKDENAFGFFSSAAVKLDVDNSNTDKSVKQIMNRWNPNRTEIVYHLSDEFAKPENKILKDLTRKTVETVNTGLAEAGVKFRISLKDPSGKIPGDIRNSMIVLVEDPVASSVIGYGPQTEDPVTGEIVSARTVMFLGTIKQFIKMTYQDILREKRALKASQKSGQAQLTLPEEIVKKTAALKNTKMTVGLTSLTSQIKEILKSEKSKMKSEVAISPSTSGAKSELVSKDRISQIKSSLKNYTALKNDEFSGNDLKARTKYLHEAKNCAISANIKLSSGTNQKLMDQIADDAKDWNRLSASEKDAVIALILPEVWVPTLIHELGHNLGLRHNFQASEDKENFYTNEQLAELGITHEMPFSSVMDYGDDLKALTVLGKYDIAALKFGYNREIEVKNVAGETIKIKIDSTLEEIPELALTRLNDPENKRLTLKDYGYCTDEHTGINAGCRRFDLGTSYSEIVANLIQSYENFYIHRNLRDGRANMSLYDDLRYARRIGGVFLDMRLMMEVRERIINRFNLPESDPAWESEAFLKDLMQASILAGKFMTRVLLTPDALCAIGLAADPSQLVYLGPLSNPDIGDNPVSCFDLKLNPRFVVVAEGGKSFNSKKDPDSKNNYADQIDVRGNWIDKMVAARTLMKRDTGIFSLDTGNDSFLNVGEVRKDILTALEGIMTDNVVTPVEFKFQDGSLAELEIPVDLSDTHVINKSIHPMIAQLMGINVDATTPFQQVIAGIVSKNAPDKTKKYAADLEVAQSVEVYRYSLLNQIDLVKGAKILDLDNTRYGSLKSNSIATLSIDRHKISSVLSKVTTEDLEKIMEERKTGRRDPPKTAPEEVKAAWSISNENIQAFLDGAIKSPTWYQKLLAALPIANKPIEPEKN